MSNKNSLSSIQLQLEEAVQMLRLVAAGKRTCLEVEDWLSINYPVGFNESSEITAMLFQSTKDKK